MKTESDGAAALLLGYAAKIEKTLWETGGRINVVLVTQSVLCLIVLAVALGISSYPAELQVSIFRLGVSFPVFLSGGSVILACSLMYQLGLIRHEERLLNSVLNIYESVGLEHKSLSRTVAHPLENPGIVTTIVALSLTNESPGPAFWVIRMFVLGIFLGLPLVGQLVVAATLIKGRLFAWVAVVLFSFAVSVWCVVLYFAAGSRTPDG